MVFVNEGAISWQLAGFSGLANETEAHQATKVPLAAGPSFRRGCALKTLPAFSGRADYVRKSAFFLSKLLLRQYFDSCGIFKRCRNHHPLPRVRKKQERVRISQRVAKLVWI